MRELPPGSRSQLRFTVDRTMLARFGQQEIHPVLSTSWLVYHLEWAARRLLESCLEAGEEGVGAGVDVRHLGPAPLGSEVLAEAEILRKSLDSFVCRVRAETARGPVAAGVVYQAVWSRERLRGMLLAGSQGSGSED